MHLLCVHSSGQSVPSALTKLELTPLALVRNSSPGVCELPLLGLSNPLRYSHRTYWSYKVCVVGKGEMFAPIFASNLVGEMANGHHRTASPSHARADRQCSPVSEVGDESEGSNVSSTPAEISPRDELAEDEVDIESESLVPKKKTASNLRTAKKLDITVTASRKVAECDDIWGALKSFIGNVAGIDGDIGEGFPYLHALIAMSKDLLRGRSGLIPKLMTVSILLRCLWDGAITSARDLDGGVSNLDHERRISLSSDTGCLIRSFYAGKDNTWEPPASLPPPSRLGSP